MRIYETKQRKQQNKSDKILGKNFFPRKCRVGSSHSVSRLTPHGDTCGVFLLVFDHNFDHNSKATIHKGMGTIKGYSEVTPPPLRSVERYTSFTETLAVLQRPATVNRRTVKVLTLSQLKHIFLLVLFTSGRFIESLQIWWKDFKHLMFNRTKRKRGLICLSVYCKNSTRFKQV